MDFKQADLKNDRVLFKKEGVLAYVTLNRPEKLNPLELAMFKELYETMEVIRHDDEISVVIVTGAGKGFCAGAELSYLHSLDSPLKLRKHMKETSHKIFNYMEDMEKIFIAAINGAAVGGGLQLALACDFRVAVAEAKLILPEIKFGLIPDAGGTNRLAKIVGASRAKEMILSGEPVLGKDALGMGLVDRVFPQESLLKDTVHYASKFTGNSGLAMGLGKLAVNKSLSQDTKSGMDDAMIIQSILMGSEPFQKAIKAFRAKQGDTDKAK